MVNGKNAKYYLNHNYQKIEKLNVFSNLRFPICHLTKRNERDKSADGNNFFFDLLVMSWSCWYPKGDGSPCGTCDMCQHRII